MVEAWPSFRPAVAAGVAVLLVVAGACSPGGGQRVVRSTDEAVDYLDDVIRGADASAALSDDATLSARLHFARAQSAARVRDVHAQESGAGIDAAWVCDGIGLVEDVGDVLPPPPNLDLVAPTLERDYPDLPPDRAQQLIDALRGIAGSDAVELADALCAAGSV